MSRIRAALSRVAGIFTRHRLDDDLREELESHLAMETDENIRRGMTPAEARRQALLASGGLVTAAESVREQRGLPWVESLAADLRYAFRALRHSPGFTLVVALTLALGIGANTAIFSVVRGVLLKPLPHHEGDRLVYLRHAIDGPGGASIQFSVPEVLDLREGAPALGGIAEFSPWQLTLDGDHERVRVPVGLVTGNYFEVMGLSPILGRVTRPADDGPGAEPVMVLAHEAWLTRFGGDSGVVGRTLRLDGQAVRVIGVLQPAPFFPQQVDGLLNMAVSEHHLSSMMVHGRTHRMTEVVARLAPEATLEEARREVEVVTGRAHVAHADAYDPGSRHRVAVIPFREVLGERARLTLWLLMGAAAFVLIISVANVANLTLMRGVRREHELVVRATLGAGTGRLRRLLLAENLVLALVGGLLGVILALGGVELLTALAARYSPRAAEIEVDGVVLGFLAALAVAVAFLLSFLATLPREGTFAAWIGAGGHRLSGGLRKQRLQRGLVVAQVAVSVILLAGAGLLTRTMLGLANVETGLETEEVLTMEITLLTPNELLSRGDGDSKERFESMRREALALPGVRAAGVGSTMPLRRSQVQFELKVEGQDLLSGEATPRAEFRTAGPEYFSAAGIPLERGRMFERTDLPGTERVVVINQTLADRLFPGEDPIGRRIALTGDVLRFTPFSGDWRTVVGIAGNTRDGGLDASPQSVLFVPFAQEIAFGGGLVIRTTGDAGTLARPVQALVRRIAPRALIEDVLTIAQIKGQSVAPRRLNAALVSSFGLLAVLIAAVGIAGVLAFSVSARTTEIGIRMSLGAEGRQVQRMIMREGGVLLGLGLVVGLTGAFFATRVIQGLLFGVAPHDPVTYAGVALLITALGLAACWVPARRASRIDPAITMRS